MLLYCMGQEGGQGVGAVCTVSMCEAAPKRRTLGSWHAPNGGDGLLLSFARLAAPLLSNRLAWCRLASPKHHAAPAANTSRHLPPSLPERRSWTGQLPDPSPQTWPAAEPHAQPCRGPGPPALGRQTEGGRRTSRQAWVLCGGGQLVGWCTKRSGRMRSVINSPPTLSNPTAVPAPATAPSS